MIKKSGKNLGKVIVTWRGDQEKENQNLRDGNEENTKTLKSITEIALTFSTKI